jgi:hypothetical protein
MDDNLGKASGMYGKDVRYKQGFGGETWKKQTNSKT